MLSDIYGKDMRLSTDIIVRLCGYIVNIKVVKIHHHRILGVQFFGRFLISGVGANKNQFGWITQSYK